MVEAIAIAITSREIVAVKFGKEKR